MNIQDISDNELDDLFKRSADEADIPFEASSWDKMKAQMETHQMYEERRTLLLPSFVLLFIMISIVVGLTIFWKSAEDILVNSAFNSIQIDHRASEQISESEQVLSGELEEDKLYVVKRPEKPIPAGDNIDGEIERGRHTEGRSGFLRNEKQENAALKAQGYRSEKQYRQVKDLRVGDSVHMASYKDSLVPSNADRSRSKCHGHTLSIKKEKEPQHDIFDHKDAETSNKVSTGISLSSEKTFLERSNSDVGNDRYVKNKAERAESLAADLYLQQNIIAPDGDLKGQNLNLDIFDGQPLFTSILSENAGIQSIKQEDSVVVKSIAPSDHGSGSIVINVYEDFSDSLLEEHSQSGKTVAEDGSAADLDDMMVTVDSISQHLMPVMTDDLEDTKKKNDNKNQGRRFAIGIGASPDFSSVGFFTFGRPGSIIGVFSEFHFDRRFAIQIGFYNSSKTYSAPISGYKATGSYWAYKQYAESIDGSCAVIDIPINIRLNAYNTKNRSFFISSGASSYLMYDQRYSFIYKNSYPTRSWHNDTRRNYYLRVVNFSIGLEQQINRSFSLQVEPFLKAPLKDVGDGKIRLITSGLQFSLKYSFNHNFY